MIFTKTKEVNYELYFKNTFTRMYLNKTNYSNIYMLKKTPKTEIFFWFRKIKEENLNLVQLYNHCIFFWLVSGNIGKIEKLSNRLNRGIRYFRYIYLCDIKFFFEFINFNNEVLRSALHETMLKIHVRNKRTLIFSCTDLNMFTNLKLSTSLYLNSIHDKLYIRFKNSSKLDLKIYLNCLKV